ncbi:MAG: ribosome maturation factor RimP [Myxococcota bacterium]|nr:ribosome maturation factor RimP [Myxococcota bacterium]
MYRDIPEELLQVIEPIAMSHELEVVEAALSGAGAQRRLRVVLDTPAGDGSLTLDQCAGVSRELRHGLDASGLLGNAYFLEVSSPGVDRVLGREVDFERAVGRQLALETVGLLDGQRRFRGELLSFSSGQLRLRTESGEREIPFSAIARAKAFDPAAAASTRERKPRDRSRRGKR